MRGVRCWRKMRSGKPSTCSSLPTVLTVLTGTRASCNSCFRRFVHLILTSHLSHFSLSLHARTSCLSHTHSSSLYESFIRGIIVWAFLGPDVCLTFSRQGATITRWFRVTLSGFGLGLPQFLCNSMSWRHKSITELLFLKQYLNFSFSTLCKTPLKLFSLLSVGFISVACLACIFYFLLLCILYYTSVCVCVC